MVSRHPFIYEDSMYSNYGELHDPQLFEEIELLTELMHAALADNLASVGWLNWTGDSSRG